MIIGQIKSKNVKKYTVRLFETLNRNQKGYQVVTMQGTKLVNIKSGPISQADVCFEFTVNSCNGKAK